MGTRGLSYEDLGLQGSMQCHFRSDEGLTLETSASESLYDGQFTLSTQLINPNSLVIPFSVFMHFEHLNFRIFLFKHFLHTLPKRATAEKVRTNLFDYFTVLGFDR